MGIKSKINIFIGAIRKANKKKILKKIYCTVRVGGLKAIKEAIIVTAQRDQNLVSNHEYDPMKSLENVNASSLGVNLYLEEQAAVEYSDKLSSKTITVIIIVPSNQYTIRNTVESIKKQVAVSGVKIKLLIPDDFAEATEPEYTTYFRSKSSIKDIVRALDSEYFILLKAGNTLAPNALYEFKKVMDKGYTFAYSDECVWNFNNGTIIKHYLKPDFSKYYLYNNLYMEKSVCFSTKNVVKISDLLEDTSDLAAYINECVLRLSDNKKIPYHIEKILLLRNHLYEKQAVEAYSANFELVKESLRKMKIRMADYRNEGFINYCKFIEAEAVEISLILIGNMAHDAINAINSIFDVTKYQKFEVILVANEEICEIVRYNVGNRPKLSYAETPEKYSYAKACNTGAKTATSDIIVFLQDNIIVRDEAWLDEIAKCFVLPFVGGVSPKILRNDNTIRYAGAIAGGFDFCPLVFNGEINIVKEDFSELAFISRETSILSASCMAVRKVLFTKVGGINDIDTPDKFSNADLSFKIAEEGYNCIFCANSQLYYDNGNWYDNWYDQKSDTAYIYMLKKWIKYLSYDPYFTYSMQKHMLDRLPTYLRIFCNENKVNNTGKGKQRNILMFIHELSVTGAPVAIHYAAKALKDNGDFPIIVSPSDGNLRKTIVEDGIPVMVNPTITHDNTWIRFASNFDLVLVCTLACHWIIKALEDAKIPTLWWAHEARESYEGGQLKNFLPESLNDNIKVFCGGEYARKMLYSYRPAYKADILLYAVPDYSDTFSGIKYELPDLGDKIVFSIVGTIMKRKGQDILAEAIMEMPEEKVKLCKFLFIGRVIDPLISIAVKKLKEKYSDEVILIDEVSRSELMDIYKQCDSVICASRDDPMPIFMTEAMMFSKICICSENTGTASLIKDGVNGFVYGNDSHKELMKKIIYVIDNINKLENMKKKARETYVNTFTMSAFSKKLITAIDTIIDKEGR